MIIAIYNNISLKNCEKFDVYIYEKGFGENFLPFEMRDTQPFVSSEIDISSGSKTLHALEEFRTRNKLN